MRFPNLLWAIRESRMAQYQVAAKVGISESRMSRAINGRIALSSGERERIASVPAYHAAWLFRAMTPPRAVQDRTHDTVSNDRRGRTQ